jgi:hypothetical protein
MLTAKEIKDKAERSYKDFLVSVVKREIFFPFHIKGNKGNANLPMQELFPALKNIIDNSKEKTGSGYTLTYKEVNTRHSGIITLPEDIFFENPQDYLQFIGKEADFLAFRKAVDLTKRQAPTLLPWLESNVLKVQKHADIWVDILKIIAFFNHKPYPLSIQPLYWRQLPIDVDLAAMEIHQPLIAELLNVILLPNNIKTTETLFEKRFSLRYDEPLLRIRFLNENEDIARPISAWEELDCENVFFITDKNVFLGFPQHTLSTIVLWEHSSDILKEINIFNGKNLFFIGDITPKGFEQLSEIRSFLKDIKTVVMDKTTFDTFPQHHENIKINNPNAFLIHLNDEELAMYQFSISLNEKNGLLQRNITHAYLLQQLKML